MGLYLLWKSPGHSSGDALGRFKKDLGLPGKSREGIGHTGTLDPFAEGVLVVGTEEATKLLAPLGGLDKIYVATALLGLTSDTLDPEGALRGMHDSPATGTVAGLPNAPSERAQFLDAFLESKLGDFEQIPPAYSAIQVGGQRAYDLARQGKEVALKARPAKLLSARHLELENGTFKDHPVLRWRFEVRVSAGTYIRCLARDWAQELTGFPGMLESLVRIGVGPFRMTTPSGYQKLGPADLGGLFGFLKADESAAAALQKGGIWRPQPLGLPALIEGPTGQVLGWTEAGSGALGRLFRADPFV